MKTKIYSLLLACAALPLFSQVGINTSTPTATLDVNGTLKVRDTPVAASVSGYQIWRKTIRLLKFLKWILSY
jgi:hypothetical protein